MKTPRIVHLDLTAFFVSVERARHPEYIGQPIMVAGSPERRGVVTCASYEVRAYGVRAGMATATALKKCPVAIRVQSHYETYAEYSKKVRAFLEPFAPALEAASIDEFFIDWTGCERLLGHNLKETARRIQAGIWEQFQLPCAIGIASNKVVAKVACDRAKPQAIMEVPHGEEADFLKPLPVQVLPGVGEVMLGHFRKYGIKTCGDIAAMDPGTVEQLFGKWGLYVQASAQGEGSVEFSAGHEPKSISTEETFPRDVTDKKHLQNELHRLSAEITEELRTYGLKARCVHVKLRYYDWVDQTRQMTILPTNDPVTVYHLAVALLEKADTRKQPVRLLGVGVSRFVYENETMDLLEQGQEKRTDLLRTVDAINRKFEKKLIAIGAGKTE